MHRDCTQKKKKKVNLLQDGNVFTVITNKAWAFVLFSFHLSRCYQKNPNLLAWLLAPHGHLQVLLLPGEGVGEALHCLRLMFGHFGLDGLCYLLDYRVDLFQKPMGLIDLIHLQGQTERQ